MEEQIKELIKDEIIKSLKMKVDDGYITLYWKTPDQSWWEATEIYSCKIKLSIGD